MAPFHSNYLTALDLTCNAKEDDLPQGTFKRFLANMV